jgi:hypothetical protein
LNVCGVAVEPTANMEDMTVLLELAQKGEKGDRAVPAVGNSYILLAVPRLDGKLVLSMEVGEGEGELVQARWESSALLDRVDNQSFQLARRKL